jgi:hypothetical protein
MQLRVSLHSVEHDVFFPVLLSYLSRQLKKAGRIGPRMTSPNPKPALPADAKGEKGAGEYARRDRRSAPASRQSDYAS